MLFLALTAAWAGTTLHLGTITVNDLTLRDVDCALTKGGPFASLEVMGALAEHKPTLDACAPSGAAARVSWTWSEGSASNISLVASTSPTAGTCVARALQRTTSRQSGTCTATFLVGDAAGAETAAASLAVPVPTPPPRPPKPPEPSVPLTFGTPPSELDLPVSWTIRTGFEFPDAVAVTPASVWYLEDSDLLRYDPLTGESQGRRSLPGIVALGRWHDHTLAIRAGSVLRLRPDGKVAQRLAIFRNRTDLAAVAGDHIAVAEDEGGVEVWSLARQAPMFQGQLDTKHRDPTALAVAADGTRLAVASRRGPVLVVDLTSGAIASLEVHGFVSSLSFDPTSDTLAVVQDGQVVLYAPDWTIRKTHDELAAFEATYRADGVLLARDRWGVRRLGEPGAPTVLGVSATEVASSGDMQCAIASYGELACSGSDPALDVTTIEPRAAFIAGGRVVQRRGARVTLEVRGRRRPEKGDVLDLFRFVSVEQDGLRGQLAQRVGAAEVKRAKDDQVTLTTTLDDDIVMLNWTP